MAATTAARRREQARDWSQPATPPRKRGELVVVDGFGVTVRVERGRLLVVDGAGRNRRSRQYSRATSKLARLVVLGGSGSLSLEALRWLNDVGAALVCVDRDGRLLCTSAATRSEAKLRRAQALAPYGPAGLEIARMLLTAKLEGQQRLLERLPGTDGYARRQLGGCLAAVREAETVEQAVAAEAAAAAAYWGRWAAVPVRYRPGDSRRVPEHWQVFGSRHSPIGGGGPRLAVNPAGAILNYLYALLEAEARLACLQLGLDPAMAVIHADLRGRDSLPLDLLEPVRPTVDAYVLAFLRDRVFAASDFHETQRGNCRLLPPLTHQLAETLPAWRELTAPVAEQVARLLLQQTAGKPVLPPTPLTGQNQRADRARRNGRQPAPPPAVQSPKPERRCKRCGGPLPHRDRTYCDTCLPHFQHDHYQALAAAGRARKQEQLQAGVDRSHGGSAAARRSATQSRRQSELRDWQGSESNGDQPADPEWFRREVLPLLHDVSLTVLARASGLTPGYLSQIRRGLKTPHPRHWQNLAGAAGRTCPPGERVDQRR